MSVHGIPKNKAAFTLEDVLAATGGDCIREGGTCVGVSTDTRSLLKGELFVALVGPNFDGHSYVEEARRRGASGFVVSRPDVNVDNAFVVRVDDTTCALGDLARFHRRRWAQTTENVHLQKEVVAVGGSVGKTTTRRAISALFESVFPGEVHSTEGNQNNLVGVPMTLLGLEAQHSIAVLELGTNSPGEMQRLSEISEPTAAVLTRISLEHTEGLGDIDGVMQEEAGLFSELQFRGLAIGNADDVRVADVLGGLSTPHRVLYGRNEEVDYRVVDASRDGISCMRVSLRRKHVGDAPMHFDMPVLGDAGVYASVAAVVVVESVGRKALQGEQVTEALSDLRDVRDGRMNITKRADAAIVIDDTYNANPESMRASIDVAAHIARERAARLVLVLGAMRELGALSLQEHETLAEYAANKKPSLVMVIGEDARIVIDVLKTKKINALFSGNSDDAAQEVQRRVEPGDVVLVKASRSLRAERVVAALLFSENVVGNGL